jgi:4'-phosphopantetheinyl transferase
LYGAVHGVAAARAHIKFLSHSFLSVKKMLSIFYTRLPQKNEEGRYHALLAGLPLILQQKSLRYKQWEDRWRNLLGKLLLRDAISRFSLPQELLGALEYTYHGRPFFKDADGIDFNISHSGNYVICTMAKGIRTGVDIEEIKNCRFDDFTNTMNEEQWRTINESPEPLRQFFTYWAIKESVIKADSRGLSIPLTQIHINEHIAQCDGRQWHLQPLKIDGAYCAWIATDTCMQDFELEYREYAAL